MIFIGVFSQEDVIFGILAESSEILNKENRVILQTLFNIANTKSSGKFMPIKSLILSVQVIVCGTWGEGGGIQCIPLEERKKADYLYDL